MYYKDFPRLQVMVHAEIFSSPRTPVILELTLEDIKIIQNNTIPNYQKIQYRLAIGKYQLGPKRVVSKPVWNLKLDQLSRVLVSEN